MEPLRSDGISPVKTGPEVPQERVGLTKVERAGVRSRVLLLDDAEDASTLDVKTFQDDRLVKWARFTGEWRGFSPGLAFHCGSGRLLLDDIVMKKLRPRPVSDGLIAFFPFAEGEGTVMSPTVGPAGMAFRVGNRSAVRWIPDGLRAAGPAHITCSDTSRALRDAWNKSKALSFETWFRPRLQAYDTDVHYVLFFVRAGSGKDAMEVSARVKPLVARPKPEFVHLVTNIRTGDDGNIVVKFYVNGAPFTEIEDFDAAILGRRLREGPISVILFPRGVKKNNREQLFDRADIGNFAAYGRALTEHEVRRNCLAGVRGREFTKASP